MHIKGKEERGVNGYPREKPRSVKLAHRSKDGDFTTSVICLWPTSEGRVTAGCGSSQLCTWMYMDSCNSTHCSIYVCGLHSIDIT